MASDMAYTHACFISDGWMEKPENDQLSSTMTPFLDKMLKNREVASTEQFYFYDQNYITVGLLTF